MALYLLKTSALASGIEITSDLVATSTRWILWNALNGVRPLSTTQVICFSCVHEVLLHVCCHLHVAQIVVSVYVCFSCNCNIC